MNQVISIRGCWVKGEELTPVSYDWKEQKAVCRNASGEVRSIRLIRVEDQEEFRNFFQ